MKRLFLVAPAVVLASVLAACSSSTSSGNSGGQPTGTAAAASGAIKLMIIGDLASPVLALPQIVTGAQAAVNQVNASGGVNGHQIKLLSCNSQANANVAAACARSAVADKVSAVVGLLSIESNPVEQILAAAHIPAIGSVDISPLDATSPESFPIQATPVQYLGQVVTMPGWQNCKHPAVLEDSSAPSAVQGAQETSKLYASLSPPVKVKIVTETPAITDLRPQTAALLAGGTDCVFPSAESTAVVTVLKDIYATGQKVKFSESAALATAPQLKQLGAAAQGVYASTYFALPGTSAAGDKFSAAMASVDPSAAQDASAENAYASVLIFAQAAKSLSNFSSVNVLHAMNSARNISVGVLPPISTFPANSGLTGLPRVTQLKEFSYVFNGSTLHLVSVTPVNVQPALSKAYVS